VQPETGQVPLKREPWSQLQFPSALGTIPALQVTQPEFLHLRQLS
jgi:hypothetical protein